MTLSASGAHSAGPGQRDAWEFFYHNAGTSYAPDHESLIVGTMRGALRLAEAEQWAQDAGALFVWEDDDQPADLQNDGSWYQLPAVCCAIYIPCKSCPEGSIEDCARKRHAHCASSLCGITESDDPQQRRDYRRVVAAELALDALYQARAARPMSAEHGPKGGQTYATGLVPRKGERTTTLDCGCESTDSRWIALCAPAWIATRERHDAAMAARAASGAESKAIDPLLE